MCVCVHIYTYVCIYICLVYSEFPSSSPCCDMLTVFFCVSFVPHCRTFISSLSLFSPYFVCSVIVLLPSIIFICHFPCLFLLPITQCLNILNCVDIASPRDFSLLQNVQIGLGAQPASYLMGTGFFPQG